MLTVVTLVAGRAALAVSCYEPYQNLVACNSPAAIACVDDAEGMACAAVGFTEKLKGSESYICPGFRQGCGTDASRGTPTSD